MGYGIWSENGDLEARLLAILAEIRAELTNGRTVEQVAAQEGLTPETVRRLAGIERRTA